MMRPVRIIRLVCTLLTDNRCQMPVLFFSVSVCVLNLQSDGGTVTDSNPHLASCCELLELVLRKGLQRQY